MASTWTFPSPERGGVAGRLCREAAPRLQLSSRDGWPLEQLEPKALMALGPELHDLLARWAAEPKAALDSPVVYVVWSP